MPVSIYLVNGIKLQPIESFDQYVVLLRNTVTQMVYKHAISTVVLTRVNLAATPEDNAAADAVGHGPHPHAAGQDTRSHLTSKTPPIVAPTVLVGVDLGVPNFDAELEEPGLVGPDGRPDARRSYHMQAACARCAFVRGSGKADEIKLLAQQHGATEILFDQSLSPGQQRNLERHLELPVNDRTYLILEIFAQRARSHEGKLQVGLARLQYLVPAWYAVGRTWNGKRGAGVRGGPGEKQIELDRRMIDETTRRTKERLSKVKRQRQTQRRQRERRDAFNISLIGYTNAGKSTLFNALVKARAYAADQLFATLDTTTRQLYLGDGKHLALSDTVGFIRDLPHGLVDVFQATFAGSD